MTQRKAGSLVGRRLGGYQVLRQLGRGGMADVYAAKHLALGRDVALKILRPDLARDADYVDRFRREARAAATLTHPHIVAVYDVGSLEGIHYIAQELIDGENLRQSLDQTGPVSVEDATLILISVASALDAASRAGITHRDIKPENIMRSLQGEIKVADFGLARLGNGCGETQTDLTQVGLTLGTPRYMSPEQVQGKPVDVRSDLYSLGVSLYHLLTGSPPFDAEEPLALAVMHLHEVAPPLDRARGAGGVSTDSDLPAWLIEVVDCLMEKSPADRFQSPAQMILAIENGAVQNGTVQNGADRKDGLSEGVTSAASASATLRLQRAADAAQENRHGNQGKTLAAVVLPRLLPLVLPLLAGIIAYQLRNRPSGGRDISSMLRSGEVSRASSIDQQYLIAASRNDESAWLSLAEYFPPDASPLHARYHSKAMLQLARLMIDQGRYPEADQRLDDLLGDPKTEKTYQVMALVSKCRLEELQGSREQLSETQSQLQALVEEVTQDNPDAAELLRRTIDQRDQISGGITP